VASARKITDETEVRRCFRAARLAWLNAGERARGQSIDGRSLNAWRMNLAGRAAPRTTALRRSRPAPPRPTALALVELVPAAASAKDVAGGGRYVLEVAGARLEFDDHGSVATLRRVLEALRSC